MASRFVAIWFPYLNSDWVLRRNESLTNKALVLSIKQHGRMIVSSFNKKAAAAGVFKGMTVADARAFIPTLVVLDEIPGHAEKLLEAMARWFIRFTPVVAVDGNDGLILDASGCAHLWGGEEKYVKEIKNKLQGFGYDIQIAMADTIGAAWAMARFGNEMIVAAGNHLNALLALPTAALRPDVETLERLLKLGLRQLKDFINMPATALRRRFGASILLRINQALGKEKEFLEPVVAAAIYQEWLPCMDPIVSAKGIEIAIQQLLERLCIQLKKEEKGLRKAVLQCFRLDGKLSSIQIATNLPSSNKDHLFKLMEPFICQVEPDLGIELFILQAFDVEDNSPQQEQLWNEAGQLTDIKLSELLDRITMRFGNNCVQRYLPDEHYWPERSFRKSTNIREEPSTQWRQGLQRPLRLLHKPEIIDVTAPIPDYPPMLFRYRNKIHKIKKADGPERIEQEWWLQNGQHRDYYVVENEEGQRFWLFRLGHYDSAKTYQWFLHGYFS